MSAVFSLNLRISWYRPWYWNCTMWEVLQVQQVLFKSVKIWLVARCPVPKRSFWYIQLHLTGVYVCQLSVFVAVMRSFVSGEHLTSFNIVATCGWLGSLLQMKESPVRYKFFVTIPKSRPKVSRDPHFSRHKPRNHVIGISCEEEGALPKVPWLLGEISCECIWPLLN